MVQYFCLFKKGCDIFGIFVFYNEYWRMGVNENMKVIFFDKVIVGKDIFKVGIYVLFMKFGKIEWEVVFYFDVFNWGLLENWDNLKVVVSVKVKLVGLLFVVEFFIIFIDNVDFFGVVIMFSWDKILVFVLFIVFIDVCVMVNINKIMVGFLVQDYNFVVQYYLNSKKDLKQVFEYFIKVMELNKDVFWMWCIKLFIQVEMGDKFGVIVLVKIGLVFVEKVGNKDYVTMFNDLIVEWLKK